MKMIKNDLVLLCKNGKRAQALLNITLKLIHIYDQNISDYN